MIRLRAENIVGAINKLPKNRIYNYIYSGTSTVLEIADVVLPEGPITIRRYGPHKGESRKDAKEQTISTQMIWRVANAFQENAPINFDRVLGGSYNTRSALEALVAHTPQFYVAYPGRIEVISSTTDIKHGHKHLIWLPNQPHREGIIKHIDTQMVISEIPGQEVIYDSLNIPSDLGTGIDIEISRRHAQIQIALIMIGRHLNYKVWIAQNDKGIIYNDKKIGEMDGVLVSLKDDILISSMNEAIRSAQLIDCIWFRNAKLMPAVIEIEHSTGITSGLSRMKKLQDVTPALMTRYVVAAPDEDRQKVVREISLPQFKSLNAKFFPYSAIEELWALCERRKIQGVTDDFLDSFMETISDN